MFAKFNITDTHDHVFDTLGISEERANEISNELSSITMPDKAEAIPEQFRCGLCAKKGIISLDMSKVMQHMSDTMRTQEEFAYAMYMCGIVDEHRYVQANIDSIGQIFRSDLGNPFGPEPSQS